MLASLVFELGCALYAAPWSNCRDYLAAKGFGHPMFALVKTGDTTMPVHDLPGLMEVLADSEMIGPRRVVPTFTIQMCIGSSLRSQGLDILVGEDGYCAIHHVDARAYFHCSQLPRFAETAYNQSTTLVTDLLTGPGR